MSHVQEDHDEAFLPFVGIIIAELTSATVVQLECPRRFPPFSQVPPVLFPGATRLRLLWYFCANGTGAYN